MFSFAFQMWIFLAYLSVLHVAVFADDPAQQGDGNQGDFKAPLPFLQAQYQHLTNLSTNGSDEISTDSPRYTTSQQVFIPSKATEKMPVANFTKPWTTLHATTIDTTTTQVLTEEKTAQGLTKTTTQGLSKTTTTQGVTKPTTRDVTNTRQGPTNTPTETKTALNKTAEVQTLMTRELSSYTTKVTKKATVSNLSGVSTLTTVSSSSSVTEKLSPKNISTTQTKAYSVSDFNSTEELYNSTVDPSRLAHTFADDFQSRDSFWPIALALTIGIPTIVVLAVTITVLYRGRLTKPRSLLAMYGQEYY